MVEVCQGIVPVGADRHSKTFFFTGAYAVPFLHLRPAAAQQPQFLRQMVVAETDAEALAAAQATGVVMTTE
jgi:hypothetical protein